MNQRNTVRNFLVINIRYLALAAAILVFLVIVLGGMVRVTGSGGACPDWPTCLGKWTPPAGNSAMIDYLHRIATFMAAVFMVLAAAAAGLSDRKERWIDIPLYVALVLLVGQITLGAFVSLVSTPSGNQVVFISRLSTTAHLGLSLAILGLVSAASVAAFYTERSSAQSWSGRLVFRSPFARLTLLAAGMVFLLLVSGGIVASSGAGPACTAWPICNPLLDPGNPALWINFIHRLDCCPDWDYHAGPACKGLADSTLPAGYFGGSYWGSGSVFRPSTAWRKVGGWLSDLPAGIA